MTLSMFTAELEYVTEDFEVKHMLIDYTADSPGEAVKSAHRFWLNRSSDELMSPIFHRLLCLKVGTRQVGEIDDTGNYNTRFVGYFFEYKVDTAGMELDQYIEHRIQKYN